MLVTDDEALAAHARKLATQARNPAPHYEHSEMGYNYRLSNLLAAVGRAQLRVLDERVRARRRIFQRYREALGDLPGLSFQPEASWGTHTRWLTCLLVDPKAFGAHREVLRRRLEKENVESRPPSGSPCTSSPSTGTPSATEAPWPRPSSAAASASPRARASPTRSRIG